MSIPGWVCRGRQEDMFWSKTFRRNKLYYAITIQSISACKGHPQKKYIYIYIKNLECVTFLMYVPSQPKKKSEENNLKK